MNAATWIWWRVRVTGWDLYWRISRYDERVNKNAVHWNRIKASRIISRRTRRTQKTKKTESNLPCGRCVMARIVRHRQCWVSSRWVWFWDWVGPIWSAVWWVDKQIFNGNVDEGEYVCWDCRGTNSVISSRHMNRGISVFCRGGVQSSFFFRRFD